MDFREYPWTSMNFRISMDVHGNPCTSMDIHGLDFQGIPWTCMEVHGLPLTSMVLYGLPRISINFQRTPNDPPPKTICLSVYSAGA